MPKYEEVKFDGETGEILEENQIDLEQLTSPAWAHRKGKRLDQDGRELPDPTPLAPPVGYNRQPSISEQIRDMVRSEALRAAAEAGGVETFEEADDFDVGDDFDPSSPYEQQFDPVSVSELRRRAKEAQDKLAKAEALAAQTASQRPAEPAREAVDGTASPDPVAQPDQST